MSSHHFSDLDCSFFPDPFFPFTNDLILSLQETPDQINCHHQFTQFDLLNPVENLHLEETFSNSSPPRHLMENLSITQETTHQCLSSAFGTINGGTETMGEKDLAENSRKIRRTGDWQKMMSHSWSPVIRDSVRMMEEESFKIGRCGAEERKEKIQKYRAKKMHRNFNKTVKYVCRKTLASNRPRIHGRFARNNEVPNIPGSVLHR